MNLSEPQFPQLYSHSRCKDRMRKPTYASPDAYRHDPGVYLSCRSESCSVKGSKPPGREVWVREPGITPRTGTPGLLPLCLPEST